MIRSFRCYPLETRGAENCRMPAAIVSVHGATRKNPQIFDTTRTNPMPCAAHGGVNVRHRSYAEPMPTAAERQALVFLAGVALLGGSVQVWRQRAARDDASSRIAMSGERVDAQLQAVDSARATRSGKKRNARQSARTRSADSGRRSMPPKDAEPLLIDVDVASASELELLPRVGPALAARIIADRDSLGAFGSLEEFGRVRGVGPAMLKLLEPVVTFSGRARDKSSFRRD